MEWIEKDGYKYKIQLVHIDTVKAGDTVICEDGQMRTVCRNNIKHDGFMGTTLFGNSYRSGYEKVKKVIFLNFRAAHFGHKGGTVHGTY